MSIFPFMDPEQFEVQEEITEELITPREWAWDFEENDFKLNNGKMYIVEGIEAIKIWIWKIFQIQRYRYIIHSWDYGHELEGLVGQSGSQSYIRAEAERLIKEAIFPTLNGYVEDIKNVEIELNNDILSINFTAITPYGEVNISV